MQRLGRVGAPTWRRGRRTFATVTGSLPRQPQTVIEKVVQKYAVDFPQGQAVKAGDYVMIRPEHVMTHDNTGPVISKCAFLLRLDDQMLTAFVIDSSLLAQARYTTRLSQSSRSTTMSKTNPARISQNTRPSRPLRAVIASTSTLRVAVSATKSWSKKDTRSLTLLPSPVTATVTCTAVSDA